MEPQKLEKRLQTLDKIVWVNLIILALGLIFSLGIAQAVIIFMTIVFVYRIYLSPKKDFKLTFLDYAVIAFFLTRLISIPVSIDIGVSVGSLRKTPFFIMTYFVVSRSLLNLKKESLKKLVQYFLIAAVIVSVYGITKYLLGIQTRVTSTASGYTTLAIFLSAVFSVSLGAGMYFNLLKNKYYWLGSLGFMLICLALTFARAQWLATFFVVFLVGVIKNRKILPISLGIVILLLLVSPNLRNRAMSLTDPIKNSSERTTIYKGAWQIFPNHFWFGHGIGSFHKIFPLKHEMVDQKIGRWHNDYLQAYMESGVFGLSIFLFLIFAIYKTGIRLFRKLKDETQLEQKGLIFGILLALTTFFIQGVASGFFGDPVSSILFWFFMGSLGFVAAEGENKIN